MLVFCRHTVVYIILPYHAQTLPTLGRFAPLHITFGDIEIYRSFPEALSETACLKLDIIVLPLAIFEEIKF